MNKSSQQKKAEPIYQKRDGDVYIEFIKPTRLARKMLYKKQPDLFLELGI